MAKLSDNNEIKLLNHVDTTKYCKWVFSICDILTSKNEYKEK